MDDTMSGLQGLLDDIRAETGVSVRFAPRGGEETRFSVSSSGREVSLWIDGAGEETERTAKLVSYLVESGNREALPEKREHLKSILLGEGGGWNAFRFITKYKISDAPCYALDILPEKRTEEALQHVERCVEERDMAALMDDTRIALVKFSSEDGQSPDEFGQFLSRSLYEESGIKARVGIGCEMKSFSQIALSYHQAATAVRMSGIFESKGEVHSYREYLLVKMLEDIPESRLKEYAEQFRIKGLREVFEDGEMASTAEEFFECSLNLSETARNLFMHRNTLTYRLDKIERITGLNIRKFSDAVTYRVMSILYKLLQN